MNLPVGSLPGTTLRVPAFPFPPPAMTSLPLRLLLLGLCLGATQSLIPCSTAVVSGSATPDGRPLLWKNRDTSVRNNEVILIETPGSYRYVGVVDRGAGPTSSVWMGVNEHGFCIENSVSNDLAQAGYSGFGNGTFMRLALAQCASIADFEQLLIDTAGQRTTGANFGVIDRQGGAAIFETSPTGYTKFDANDPATAPHGFVVRSNFSFTGRSLDLDAPDATLAALTSGDRYLRMRNLLTDAAVNGGGITHAHILQQVARDMADRDGVPIPGTLNDPAGTLPTTITTGSIVAGNGTIAHGTTVSVAVFQGVLPDEDPLLTTMWTILGQPNFSMAVPVWPGITSVSNLLRSPQGSAICDLAITLRDHNFPTAGVLNTTFLPAIWSHNLPHESASLATVATTMEGWRQSGFTAADLNSLHGQIATATYDHLVALDQAITWPEPGDAMPLLHYWDFSEPAGTVMSQTQNLISPSTRWSGDLLNSTTTGEGTFRIQRDGPALNRRADVGATQAVDPIYLVIEIDGWNLGNALAPANGQPYMSVQFMNGLAADFPSAVTAGFTLEHLETGAVTLMAEAYGEGAPGGQPSDAVPLFGSVLDQRLVIMTAFSPSADEYSVSYRLGDGPWEEFFNGTTSGVREAVSFRILVRGDFDAGGQNFLDISRFYVSSVAPDALMFPGRINNAQVVAPPSGARSDWDFTDLTLDVGIGAGATGSLLIPAGEQVLFTRMSLGRGDPSAAGSVTLAGPDARLDSAIGLNASITPVLNVGEDGTGELVIRDGATLLRRTIHLGFNAGSSGTVTVTGAGSTMTTPDAWTLRVGQLGTGLLNILDGAVVDRVNELYVGNINDDTANNGTVTQAGVGTIYISGGGSLLTASSGRIGNRHGTTGTVAVEGTGSLLSMGSFLHVGSGGNGTLSVTDGATATVVSSLSIGANQRAHEQNAAGHVHVAGSGSSLTNTTWLHVGRNAVGSLLVEDGGLVQVGTNLIIGAESLSPGVATVRVDGGRLVAGGNLQAASSSTLAVVLRGPGHAGIEAQGITLDGARLDLELAYPPAVSDLITLIENRGSTPVSGRFTRDGVTLEEGASLQVQTGPHSATFRITYAGGTTANDVVLEVLEAPPPNAYFAWIAGHASIAPADQGPLANPSGDGIANVLKFVLGLDPTVRHEGALLNPRIEPSAEGGVIVLDLPLNDAAILAAGLTLHIEVAPTPDPSSWLPVDPAHIETLPGPVTRIRIPTLTDETCFLRLRIEGTDGLE